MITPRIVGVAYQLYVGIIIDGNDVTLKITLIPIFIPILGRIT